MAAASGWACCCVRKSLDCACLLRDVAVHSAALRYHPLVTARERQTALLKQAANAALTKSFQDAKAMLLSRLSKVQFAALSTTEIRNRPAAGGEPRNLG